MTKLLMDLCMFCAGYWFFLFAFPHLIHFDSAHFCSLIIWLFGGILLVWRLGEAFVVFF